MNRHLLSLAIFALLLTACRKGEDYEVNTTGSWTINNRTFKANYTNKAVASRHWFFVSDSLIFGSAVNLCEITFADTPATGNYKLVSPLNNQQMAADEIGFRTLIAASGKEYFSSAVESYTTLVRANAHVTVTNGKIRIEVPKALLVSDTDTATFSVSIAEK